MVFIFICNSYKLKPSLAGHMEQTPKPKALVVPLIIIIIINHTCLVHSRYMPFSPSPAPVSTSAIISYTCFYCSFTLLFFLAYIQWINRPSKYQNTFSGKYWPCNIYEEHEPTWRKESKGKSKSKVRFISSYMYNKVQPMRALCASGGGNPNNGREREPVLSHSVEVYVPEQHIFTLGNANISKFFYNSIAS